MTAAGSDKDIRAKLLHYPDMKLHISKPGVYTFHIINLQPEAQTETLLMFGQTPALFASNTLSGVFNVLYIIINKTFYPSGGTHHV